MEAIPDLTIILCTPNLVPKEWARYHRQMLTVAIGDTPIITISKEPLDWGINLRQEGYGLTNLYFQVLRGAELAKTKFVATVDDDTLYPPEHFRHRPDTRYFYYNLNRWHLFTWGQPFYFHKPRPGGGLMIANRDMVAKALDKRFGHEFDENGELPGRLCHELGSRSSLDCDGAKAKGFYTNRAVVSFYHEQSIDEANRTRRKYAWPVRALDIPYWGRADILRGHFR